MELFSVRWNLDEKVCQEAMHLSKAIARGRKNFVFLEKQSRFTVHLEERCYGILNAENYAVGCFSGEAFVGLISFVGKNSISTERRPLYRVSRALE